MFIKLILAAILTLVSCECTNMLFLEHITHVKQLTKSTSIMVSPSLIWKDNIINNMQANEIFKNIDFNKYELMTHAYKEGLIIHRVCEKNSKYPKYGKITNTEMRGYIVDVKDMFMTDMFLYNNLFTTYAHGHQKHNFIEYKMKNKEKMQEEYKKKYPNHYFIIFIIIPKLFYLFILYIIKIVIYNF